MLPYVTGMAVFVCFLVDTTLKGQRSEGIHSNLSASMLFLSAVKTNVQIVQPYAGDLAPVLTHNRCVLDLASE